MKHNEPSRPNKTSVVNTSYAGVLASPELTPPQQPLGYNEVAFRVLARRTERPHLIIEYPHVKDHALDILSEAGIVPLASTRGVTRLTGSMFGAFENELVYLQVRGERVSAELQVAARTPEAARATFDRVVDLVSLADVAAGSDITVRFWHGDHSGGAMCHARTLGAPTIEGVLPILTARSGDALLELETAGWQQGGIHVWHGPPGCGKTTAIRALALAWRDHLAPEIVLDPETMLANTEYMMRILHSPPHRHRDMRIGPPPRRLLVLEDAGELVGVDARAHAGAGLSRLLNLTDGMFGRDEAPIVIITTNEPVTKLHPAMMRPGRCRSVIEFGRLPIERAQQWLDTNADGDHVATSPMSIAELAAIADTSGPLSARSERVLGFAV